MTTATKPRTPDLLSLLQAVKATEPGDLNWARHRTRREAVLLRLNLPHGRAPQSLDVIAAATGIPIWTEHDLPASSTTLLGSSPAIILVNANLSHDEQLRACLRELKKLIDLPARLRQGDDAYADDAYRALADHFADLVLEEHGP